MHGVTYIRVTLILFLLRVCVYNLCISYVEINFKSIFFQISLRSKEYSGLKFIFGIASMAIFNYPKVIDDFAVFVVGNLFEM